jgi:hypothetical protein
MVDAADRPVARFPASKVAVAAARIGAVLDRLGAGPADLALTQGAAGGDLLFGEACVARGVRLCLLLPADEATFVAHSLLPSADGDDWKRRFDALKSRLVAAPFEAPAELGELPPGADPYERCNLWLLATARRFGAAKLRFVCLWDGGAATGRGGTRHMIDEARRRGAHLEWIDSREL